MFSFSSVNKSLLISLVEKQPVLWDPNCDLYKSKTACKMAWNEVCLLLIENFHDLEGPEKNVLLKEVSCMWRNIRDAYTRSKRKMKTDKTTRGGAGPRDYIYSQQLKFLSNEDSECETEGKFHYVWPFADNSASLAADQQSSTKPTSDKESKKISLVIGRNKRRRREVEVEEQSMEEPTVVTVKNPPNRHLSFFQGVIPSLEHFDDDEVVEFQMGVLQLIQNIKRRKKNICQ